MQSNKGSEYQRSGPSAPCALWPVDLKLTHLDWNPDATLIHLQGQYLTMCELDYNILQGEIQIVPKTKAAVNIGEFCLVEDVNTARWYRGRVQSRKQDLFDVFLIDHGNVLSVDIANMSSCSNDLFILPPKIVCGFLANVLLLEGCHNAVMEDYFTSQIGRNVTGYIQAVLPHKILLLEIPDMNMDLVRQGFGRHVDTNTFLLLVEMLTEVSLKQNVEPAPDLLIENPREQEFCFKPFGLQGYEDILSFCGPRLHCGTRAKVRVTAAVNPGLFYCQMSSIKADLLEMSKKLAAVCESRTKERKTPENLGLLCAVKGKDGNWYRGFVQFLPVNSQVRVLFIDYGFFESVKVENIHRLPPDFDSTPFLMLPCSLRSDQDESVKAQQLSYLKAGLLGNVLDVEISSFDEDQHLYVITVIGAEDSRVKEPDPIQELPKIKVKSDTEELPLQCGFLYHETVMCEAFGKTLEAEELQVDSVFVGYVIHVQNPNHFWIRTQKRNDDFEEMMKKMKDHFQEVKLEEDVLLNPEPGTLCCAVYEEDLHFYRAVVTCTLEHGAEVLFIDFGNIEKVPHMLIKNIPKTFASQKAFAFCCSLVNVLPLSDVWTSSNCDFFRRAVSNKVLQVHVLQMRKNKCVVDLCELGNEGIQSVSELLTSSKQAEYWNIIPIKRLVQNNTGVTEKTRSQRRVPSVTPDINGNTKQLKDGEEEEKSSQNEPETAQAPLHFKVRNIKPGFEFAVCCSDINSPSDFWCQPLDNVPALEDLMDKVQQYYSTHSVTLQSDDLCCVAKSPQDGRWYRAFITEKERGHAKVIFVDYGHTIQIKDNNLQAIMPGYVELEGQAFRCSLYNRIEPADSEHCGYWSPEVCNALKNFVRDNARDLRCKVVSQLNVNNKGLCNVVDLYNTETQQSITNLLLRQGLVREVTVSTEQLPTAFPESFVFSSYDLSPGDDEQVYLTHVSNKWEVYCHLERNTDIIEELEMKISEESDKIAQASTKAVGKKLCLAKYLDGKWYRGVAHRVQSPLHLGVFFVDYGNTDILEKTQIMFIPRDCRDLLYTPMQALKCNLASVLRDELRAVVKEWLNHAVLNQQVRAHIVGKAKDGTFDVELFNGEVNINEKVNQLIASHSPKPKPAVSSDIQMRTKPKAVQPRGKMTSVKCKSQLKGRPPKSTASHAHQRSQVGTASFRNRENAKKHVPGEILNKYTKVKTQSKDETKSRVPVKPQRKSHIKERREFPDTDVTSEQPQHTEKTEVPQLSCLPDMNVTKGFSAICFVSHIDSASSFFLQLSEDEPAILKMGQDLNSGVLRESLKTTTSLRINDLVLAEYEGDGALYRSAVMDCEESPCVKIEFVDYGNSAMIGKDKIYSLPEECLSQPRFSIPCSLIDARIYSDDTSFSDAVMEKPLMVDFLHRCGTHWEVQVEILDGVVHPVAPLETAVESSTKIETEETDLILDLPPPILTPRVASPSLRLKVTKCRAFKKRLRNRSCSKTRKCTFKARSVCKDGMMRLTIQAKDTENCEVLAVLSNSNFYVRPSRTRKLLPVLQSHIDTNLHKFQMVAEEDLQQGLKCLIQVEENKQWHRAVVQSVSQGKCLVLLMDHGLTEEISSGSIRRQCSDLTKTPGLAVLCTVNCLGFSEAEDAAESWCETLKPMIGSEVKLVFVSYSEADQLWRVEIIMNELFLIRQTTTTLQQREETIPPAAENQNETEGISDLDASRPPELSFAPVELNGVYSGCAAAVITPFDFCVVLEDSLLVLNKVSIMLDDLSGQMCPLPEAHLTPGSGCLFRSDPRNKWCRAEIVQSDSTVVLNLVDYGHYESIPYESRFKLKRLPVKIADLPKVIYPCSLRGVEPVRADGLWSGEAAVYFEQRLHQKKLQIFFREFVSNTEWKVDILADDLHVATELVDAGHARYTDSLLGLRLKEQIPCKAAARSPGGEEECGQEDEVSDWRRAFLMKKRGRCHTASECLDLLTVS